MKKTLQIIQKIQLKILLQGKIQTAPSCDYLEIERLTAVEVVHLERTMYVQKIKLLTSINVGLYAGNYTFKIHDIAKLFF